MEFTMKDLRKRGCIRAKEEDFRDDGNRFKIYYYKGLRISYLKSLGEYYLAIHLPEGNYIYDDYKDREWYKLCDEFNGCDNIDPDKVIENCETIIRGIVELENEIAKEEKVDLDLLYLVKNQEIEMAEKVVNEFKSGQYIWQIEGDYEMRWVMDSVRRLVSKINQLKVKEFYDLSNKELRELANRLNKDNYLYIKEDDSNIQRLKKYMA